MKKTVRVTLRETLSALSRDSRFLFLLGGLLLATGGIFALLAAERGVSPPPPPTESVEVLDLRGQELTLEEVEALRAESPELHIRWDVPVAGVRCDSDSRALSLPDFSAADRDMLKEFPRLEVLDASGSRDYETLLALRSESANLSVRWTVPLGKQEISSETDAVNLKKNEASAEELMETLRFLPALRLVDMPQCGYSVQQQAELMRAYPEIRFRWIMRLCGASFLSTAKSIDLSGREDLTEDALRELRETAGLFYDLEEIDLSDTGLSGDEILQLDEALGDGVDVVWTIRLYGAEVRSNAEEIDLSGRTVRDKGAAVEEAIPWMPKLKKVIMAECGVKDADMDALNQKYEDIRFVWLVRIKFAGIRTDSDFFIPYRESGVKQFPNVAGLSALQYCPDLVALDLGHSNIKDLSYLEIMPHLKYLILADSWIRDIELVGELKELTWLELFKTVVDDISPLTGCTSLEHLNICYIIAPGDNVYETLRQMTWLKRLWCCGTLMTDEQVESLRRELPDCQIFSKEGAESTGATWRYHPAYYEMRDAFHMYYMSDDGNTVGRLSDEKIAALEKKYFG